MNIGINGFGRIGRLVLRNALSRPNVNVVAINDLYPTDYLAYLLKYDSSHGRLNQKIRFDKNHLFIGEKKIAVSSKKNPSEINWKTAGADYIIESTGLFVTRDLAQQHLTSGAKKVILSCPSKDEIPMYVMGVNHKDYKKEDIVSNAQKYQPAEDADIDDDEAVPLNTNASQVSFDNFEKENASEKKRKKIYMTEDEIQKLIEKRKNDKQDPTSEVGVDEEAESPVENTNTVE